MSDLLEHCVLTHELITSQVIMNELHEQLANKFKYTSQEANEAITLLASQMEVVAPLALGQPVCRDVDDDQIIGTALAGHVRCIVTGNKDLLVLERHAGIEIVSPAGFLEFEASLT